MEEGSQNRGDNGNDGVLKIIPPSISLIFNNVSYVINICADSQDEKRRTLLAVAHLDPARSDTCRKTAIPSPRECFTGG